VRNVGFVENPTLRNIILRFAVQDVKDFLEELSVIKGNIRVRTTVHVLLKLRIEIAVELVDSQNV